MFKNDKPSDHISDATGFLLTFNTNKGHGHSSLYVEGPDGKFIYTSYWPLGRTRAMIHNKTAAMVPVGGGFNEEPERDVKWEKTPPESILKIENLNFARMEKHHQKYMQQSKSNLYFSLAHNSVFNPIHHGLRFIHMHARVATLKVGDFDPILDDFPNSDHTLSISYKKGKKSAAFFNCAEAVHQCVSAGSPHGEFELKHETQASKTLFSFFSKKPSTYQDAVKKSGATEMIDKPQQLPAKVQEVLQFGYTRYPRENPPKERLENQESAIEKVESFSM